MTNKMSIKEYLLKALKENHYTLSELADELDINYKTLYGKLNRESLKVSELMEITNIIRIDLNDMQEKCTAPLLVTGASGIIEKLKGKGIGSSNTQGGV